MGKLLTKLYTITEFKQLAMTIFLNNTSNASKVSEGGVLNGFFFGLAKLGQKAMKEIAVLESQIFPEASSGSYLDTAATLFGVDDRLTAVGSSTYILVKGDEGTEYIPGVHKFTSKDGIEFAVTSDVVIGAEGIAYVPVKSLTTGVSANVQPHSITTVSPKPSGHDACVNEYMAIYGLDAESDTELKIRIKNKPNLVAQETLSRILMIVQTINENVIRLIATGINNQSQKELMVVLRNGGELYVSELSEIENQIRPYLGLSEIFSYGSLIDIDVINTQWDYFDLDFRVDIDSSFSLTDVRKDIQVAVTKLYDFRLWDSTQRVEWDNLLEVVKGVDGVKYVSDGHFSPNADIIVATGRLPRIQGFIMRDLSGAILYQASEVLDVFYG